MVCRVFREFEAYESAIADADLKLIIPRLDQPRWELDTLMAGRLHLQWGREGSGTIAEVAASPEGRIVFVAETGGHLANGQILEDGMALVADPGADFVLAAQVAHDWYTVFIPSDLLNAVTGVAPDRSHRSESHVVRPGKASVDHLRSLIRKFVAAADREPDVLATPACTNSAQADLLAACLPILGIDPTPTSSPAPGRPTIPRDRIIRTARETIEQSPAETLGVRELAAAVGVSVRTLRNVFHQTYGVPPLRYLRLHRLHQARSALREACPEGSSVTSLAARFGFWEFGRFASDYRRLFGEMPSATLLRSRPNVQSRSLASRTNRHA